MITPLEVNYIKSHAYVPEHITDYVAAISEKEPFLIKNYLYYWREGDLIFIGYPLKEPIEEKEMKETLDSTIENFKPEHVAIIAPAISMYREGCSRKNSDHYYKLDLFNLHIHQKLRNMINHASRELYIDKKQEFSGEHMQLVSEFLGSHDVGDYTRFIFERIPKYVSSVPTALIFSARSKAGRLVAFDIAEFGAKEYAFYMFSFMSRRYRAPGASDILLYEVIKTAREQGKSLINLGLGINKGIIFFKKKWGGIPFLNYEFCIYCRNRTDKLKSLYEKL
jgi:hypothetical protein